MKQLLIILSLVACCSFKKSDRLKPYTHFNISIDEPSDICVSSLDPTHYFIVSNRGCIAETDGNGKVIRKTKYDGSDYESICIKDGFIYAMDESLRRIDILDEKDFKLKKSVLVPYSGGRNKGVEGLTYIPSLKKFIAVIEKPGIIVELDEQLHETGTLELKQFGELSSITWHNDYLWMLGDEDHEIMKVSAADYTIVQRWKIPVTNPEGIAFDTNGDLLIISDDMSMLFKFKIQ